MFQIGGMASGLDTTTIIEQLMMFERKPIAALQQRKSAISQKDSAFQAINTRLSALKSKLSDLTMERNLKAKKVTTSADSVLSAAAGAGAAEGTYRVKVNQLATATSVGSAVGLDKAALGKTALSNVPLSELKPANTTAIKTGTFTIGGATLRIEDESATLDDVIAAINVAGGKAPDASYRPGKVVVLDANGAAYYPVDGDPSLPNLTGLGGAAASLTANGQIQLDVALNRNVAIGSGADTSNFLTVAGLKSPTVDGDIRTGARMSVAQVTKPLNDANFATPITGDADGKGVFKINGVEIAYNLTSDALNDVLNRINSSGAGVVASYNSIEDRLVLTNKTTGNAAIGLEDVTGNFLAATKLVGASQTTGQNARITIDGVEGILESSTNEFKNVVPGLIFTAKEEKTSDWTTITVSSDTDATVNTIKGFINEFNATIDAIEAARAKGKPLQGDSALSGIMSKLYRLVYEPVSGLSGSQATLSSIGIGTTAADRKHLSLNEAKFKEVLANNPDRVAELFNKDLAADNPTGVAGRLRAYLNEIGGSEGVFASRKDSASRQTKYIDDQIESYEVRLEQRRRILVGQFTAMEKAVGLMKSQQSALMSQLGSLQSQ